MAVGFVPWVLITYLRSTRKSRLETIGPAIIALEAFFPKSHHAFHTVTILGSDTNHATRPLTI